MFEAIESRLYGPNGTSSAEHALSEIREHNYKVQPERASLAGDHTGAWVGSMVGDVAGGFISIIAVSAYGVYTDTVPSKETYRFVRQLCMFGGLLVGAWIGDKFDDKHESQSTALNYYTLKGQMKNVGHSL